MNILIVRLGSIGDIVHTLPALAALRRRFPDARIDWLVEFRCHDILLGNPCIDTLLEVDTLGWRRRPFLPSTWKEGRESVRRLRSRTYDIVFDFQGLLKSGLLARLSRSHRRVGFGREHLREPLSAVFTTERLCPPDGRSHVIDKNLYLLTSVGIKTSERSFPIQVPGDLERRAALTLESMGLSAFAALSPGGGWRTKRWSPSRYGELARELERRWAIASVVFWGPGEEGLAQEVVRVAGGSARKAPPTSVREMIPYLARAQVFVGGDTGPLHVAGALGVPVVGLFGPSDPVLNGPFRKQDQVVGVPAPCSPCYKRRCPGYGTVCMESLEVERVLEAVGLCLKKMPPAPAVG